MWQEHFILLSYLQPGIGLQLQWWDMPFPNKVQFHFSLWGERSVGLNLVILWQTSHFRFNVWSPCEQHGSKLLSSCVTSSHINGRSMLIAPKLMGLTPQEDSYFNPTAMPRHMISYMDWEKKKDLKEIMSKRNRKPTSLGCKRKGRKRRERKEVL